MLPCLRLVIVCWAIPALGASPGASAAPSSGSNPPAVGNDTVLTLTQTLALAEHISFNPYVECWRSFLAYKNMAFLGPLHRVRTGDVEQAYYRFRRTAAEGGAAAEGPIAPEKEAEAEAAGGPSEGDARQELRRSLLLSPASELEGSLAGAAGAGDAAGEPPPLMLIPGLGATMSTWGWPLLWELSCSREVIIFENRGVGLSIDYAPGPLTYYSMADSVVQLIDALNLTAPPDILGWSSGGNIALVLATQHGGKVGRIVGLGAMAGSNNMVLPNFPDIFAPDNWDKLSLKEQMALLFPPQDEDFKAAVCQYLGDVFWMPHSTTQVNASVFRAMYETDVEFTTKDPTVWNALPSVTNPLLLLNGHQDVLVPAVNADLIAARVPGALYQQLPRQGHAYKDVTEFVGLVNAFLDSELW